MKPLDDHTRNNPYNPLTTDVGDSGANTDALSNKRILTDYDDINRKIMGIDSDQEKAMIPI